MAIAALPAFLYESVAECLHQALENLVATSSSLDEPHNAQVLVLDDAITFDMAASDPMHGVWVFLLRREIQPVVG
jgi:hypothetical protein